MNSENPKEKVHPKISARILVAEDTEIHPSVISEILGILGCSYRIASSRDAVFSALREESFDLILMDGRMSGGAGYEAAERIRQGEAGESSRRTPILDVSANGPHALFEKHLQHGMNDYVTKPVVLEELAEKIQFWTERGQTVVDFAALKRLRQIPRGNELIQDLAQLFFADTPKVLGQLEAMNVKEGEPSNEFTMLAHSLKSNCATLGAFRMKDLAYALEKAKLSTFEERSHLIFQLRIEYDFFQNQFAQKCAG